MHWLNAKGDSEKGPDPIEKHLPEKYAIAFNTAGKSKKKKKK